MFWQWPVQSALMISRMKSRRASTNLAKLYKFYFHIMNYIQTAKTSWGIVWVTMKYISFRLKAFSYKQKQNICVAYVRDAEPSVAQRSSIVRAPIRP